VGSRFKVLGSEVQGSEVQRFWVSKNDECRILLCGQVLNECILPVVSVYVDRYIVIEQFDRHLSAGGLKLLRAGINPNVVALSTRC